MKRFYFAAAIAAMASAVFCSCNNQDEVTPPLPEKAELGFSSVVTADLQTRADAGNKDLNAAFKINLDGTDVYTEAVTDQKVEFSTNKYTITPTIYLLAASRNLTAWAPDTVSPDQTTAPNVFTLTPGEESVAVDFRYQEKLSVNSANCTDLSLTLVHAFAKLTFTLNATNYPFAAPSLTSLVVKGTPGASTINIFEKKYVTASDADLTVVSAATDFTSPNTVAALVVPKTPATLELDCTLDGTNYTGIAVTGITKLEAGANYNITINITGKEINISGVQVPDWTTGDNGSADLN